MSGRGPRSGRCRASVGTAPGSVALATLVALSPIWPAATWAADEPPPPAFVVKGDPRTGSNLPSTLVTGSRIPLNRSYDQLTPGEQRIVRNWYEAMPETDEPPFPRDGLGSMYAALQKTAAFDHELGEWTFGVAIGPDGTATDVSLLRGDATEGTRHMAMALLLQKYKPARCHGEPCAMTLPVRFTMRRKL